MRGFPNPLWTDGKYAVYKATKANPLPPGMRCLSSSDLMKAIGYNPSSHIHGIMLRQGISAGFAKYLIDQTLIDKNELGEISL